MMGVEWGGEDKAMLYLSFYLEVAVNSRVWDWSGWTVYRSGDAAACRGIPRW